MLREGQLHLVLHNIGGDDIIGQTQPRLLSIHQLPHDHPKCIHIYRLHMASPEVSDLLDHAHGKSTDELCVVLA